MSRFEEALARLERAVARLEEVCAGFTNEDEGIAHLVYDSARPGGREPEVAPGRLGRESGEGEEE